MTTGTTIAKASIGPGYAGSTIGAIAPSADSAVIVVPQQSKDSQFRFLFFDLQGSRLRIAEQALLETRFVDKLIYFSGEDVLVLGFPGISTHLHRTAGKWRQVEWSEDTIKRALSLVAPAQGNGLVLGSTKGELVVVEPVDGHLRVNPMSGHQSSITAAWVDLASARAVTGDEEGFLKIWDLTSGAELFSTRVGQLPVGHIALTEDGKTLLASVVSGEGREPYLLNADVAAPVNQTATGEAKASVLPALRDATPAEVMAARNQLLWGDFSQGEALLKTAVKTRGYSPSQLETELVRARMARAFTLTQSAEPFVTEPYR